MDQDKVAQFVSHYRSLDSYELTDLYERRENLVEDAVIALETVFSEKGISKEVLERYSNKTADLEITSEDELGRRLSNGKLAMACKLAFMMDAWSPAVYALNLSGIGFGALGDGLLVFALGFVGYRVGNLVTTSIYANQSTTFTDKKRRLWFVLLGATVMYFLLFVFVGAIVPAVR